MIKTDTFIFTAALG